MVGLIITLLLVIPISVLWVRGVDKMNNEHPDYKGGDFLNWDDNKNHTEGGL